MAVKRRPPKHPAYRAPLLRYGAEATAMAAILALVVYVAPWVRGWLNNDPMPWVGHASFDEVRQAVQGLPAQLNNLNACEAQRELDAAIDRKASIDVRLKMDPADPLANDVLTKEIAPKIARLQKKLAEVPCSSE